MKYEYYKRLKLSRRKDLFNQYLDMLDWSDWRDIMSVSDLIDDFKYWIERGGHLIGTKYEGELDQHYDIKPKQKDR